MKVTEIGNGFEALEDRTLLAGNVTATLVGTTLDFEGDAQSNAVSVVQSTNGDVTVTGLAGTTINGQHSVVYHSSDLALVTDIVANGNSGNDYLAINNLNFSGNVVVNGNDGNDVTAIVYSKLGNLALDGGAGINVEGIASTNVTGDLFIGGGASIDSVGISNSTVGGFTSLALGDGTNVTNLFNDDLGGSLLLDPAATSVEYLGGTGNDVVALNFVRVHNGATELSLGDGNNALAVLNSKLDTELEFLTGSGSDRITLINVQTNEFDESTTGAGNDLVFIQNLNVLGGPSEDANLTSLDLGDGNDVLTMLHSSFAGQTFLTGGNGNDLVTVATSTFNGTLNADLGAGNDTLISLGNNLVAGGVIDGGTGFDTLFARLNRGFAPTVIGFERIL